MRNAGTLLDLDEPTPPGRTASVAVLAPDARLLSGELRAAWQRLDAQNTHVYAMYQSLAWWEHLQATGQADSCRLAIVRDEYGTITGIVPLQIDDHHLTFDVGKRCGLSLPVRTAFVLGGEPMVPRVPGVHARLFDAVWQHSSQLDGIYLKGMPAAGTCWAHLQHGLGGALVYAERGIREFFTITLPPTFDDYLARFKQKKRYNLKRQVKLLRQAGGGVLDLVRVDSEAHISAFLNEARHVAEHSWQHRLTVKNAADWADQERVLDLARRGFLRCYLLRAGTAPCAYVIGYQCQEVFHYSDIGYDERFAHYSPGAVLLYLLIDDLIRHRPPRLLNFGIGDSQYKSQFATDRTEEASVLLLRKTASNQLRYATHRGFRMLGRGVKRLLPGGLPAAPVALEVLELLSWV